MNKDSPTKERIAKTFKVVIDSMKRRPKELRGPFLKAMEFDSLPAQESGGESDERILLS